MQVVILSYKVPLETVDSHRPAHVEWLRGLLAEGVILAAGRQTAGNGGVLLMRGERAATEAVLEGDPYKINGVADYEVYEFTPSMTAPGLEALAG